MDRKSIMERFVGDVSKQNATWPLSLLLVVDLVYHKPTMASLEPTHVNNRSLLT